MLRWKSQHCHPEHLPDDSSLQPDSPSITYLQKIRIETAKKQLEGCTRSIDAIGVDVGYFDPSHFRQLFKRRTGVTPSKYRKKFQIVW
ncbi:MAG TPA: AraC family transcriptional regulator [Gammaproteobacteria bacterium]|nr:AraC family transcriptional regulator [Gammaproteobacteria bacterium]